MRRFIKAGLIVFGFFFIVFILLGVFAPGPPQPNDGEVELDTEVSPESSLHYHIEHQDAEDHPDVPKIHPHPLGR